MRHIFFAPFLLLFFTLSPAWTQVRVTEARTPIGQLTSLDDPKLATIKLDSHGATTVGVYSTQGKTIALGCGHAYPPDMVGKEMKLSGPRQKFIKGNALARAKLLALDRQTDLSLIEISNGPFYHVKIAPEGYKTGKDCWSIGYDNLKWPPTKRPATVISISRNGQKYYTRERPWHGRSGGLLSEKRTNYLVGIVTGYEGYRSRWTEIDRSGMGFRGYCVSHPAIVRFLKTKGYGWLLAKNNQAAPPQQRRRMPYEPQDPNYRPGPTDPYPVGPQYIQRQSLPRYGFPGRNSFPPGGC